MFASQQNYRVKPLEWEHLGGDFFRASAPLFGNIRVERYGDFFTVSYSVPGFSDVFVEGDFGSADEAKVAAQTEYDKRMRSVLVPLSSANLDNTATGIEDGYVQALAVFQPKQMLATINEVAMQADAALRIGGVQHLARTLEAISEKLLSLMSQTLSPEAKEQD